MTNGDFKIRVAGLQDAQALLDIYKKYITDTAVSFETQVPSVEEFRDRISEVLDMYPYLVAEVDGRVAGYAYAHRYRERAAFDWAVEVSIYVGDEFKKMGIGTSLYANLERIMAEQGVRNSYACVAEPLGQDPYLTYDSKIFHEKVGYKLEGRHNCAGYKFGRWYNMLLMEKFLGEHDSNVKPIIPFTEDML